MENLGHLDHSFRGILKVKDKYFQTQKRKVFNSFFAQPKTMLMVAIETGIERANICRYVAALRKENRIHLVRKGICPITKHRAGFLTTNVKFLKPESHE